ncbi:hypothetical protein [Shimia ponticola]|uniref:hypothetical protein n=1 Tax=Shimia ponticola TaxID=2582893 RepID=UPI0011BE72F9|nr:hypothetical protein [Shimia ponticola]
MIQFLEAQPPEHQDHVMDLLGRGAVQMAVMLHLDFAAQPVWLSNRNVPFVDQKWGYTWGAGGGLLVSLPDLSGGDDQLAPFHEYRLGIPNEWIDRENWAAELVQMVGDRSDYVGRDSGLYGQLFDPDTNQPAGHPFAFDIGIMDRMKAAFPRGGAIVSLTTESFMARKGVPVYGMLTYLDQKRRHANDEGLQFVTEANKLITWTDW